MSDRIPEGWENLPVNKAFEIGRGRVISRDEIRDNTGPYPVYSSQSKNNGKMGSLRTFDFEGEYVTWTTDGAYAGTVFHRSGRFNCTNVCGTLRDTGVFQVEMRFVAEYLSTVAKNHVSYVGNPKLMNGIFGEIELLLPPLPEQKKIAAILTSVDEVIEATQRQIDKLQDLKKATMNELLTKGIGHTEFKDSELGRIPKSWEVVALGAIGDFSKGKGISKKETTSEGVPCLRYAEIYTEYDFVIGTFKSFIRSETISTTKKLKTNDIIFAGSGETVEDIGKSVAFVSDCDAYVGGDSIVFSPNIQCNSVFLSYQLNDDLRRIQLRKLGQGSSVIHVYTSGIMQLNVSLPPLLEQNKIAEALLSYTRAIAAKKQKLAQTQSLKKALMQDLLTGKVRVQVN